MPLPPQPKTPYLIFTAHDTADGLKTGVRRTFDFFRGMNDQALDMVNPVSIYKSAHEFGVHEANIYIPDPDGHTEDGDAYARQMGHAILDSFNPLNKKSAYDTGKTATNIGTVIVPGVEELNALKGLKAARVAADGDVAVASAAAERAAGTPGRAAAEEALRGAEARRSAAHEAYQARLPGAGARKMAAKAKAAAQKAKERRTGGAEPPVRTPAPRTPEQVAAAERKFNRQKQDALEDARHHRLNQRQPALAGARPHSAEVARPTEAPGGNSTAAIGKPGVMQMAGGASTRGLGLRPDAIKNLEKLENLKQDPLGEINSEVNHNHYSAARIEAKGTVVAINKKTGKPRSHIGDLQQASDGLDNVSDALKHELDHPPSTITDRGREILQARYFEAQRLQNRVKGRTYAVGVIG